MCPFTRNGKRVLAVNDEPDILEVRAEKRSSSYTHCTANNPISSMEASRHLTFHTYGPVIPDILGVQGFKLPKPSTWPDLFPIILTTDSLNPETLKKSLKWGEGVCSKG